MVSTDRFNDYLAATISVTVDDFHAIGDGKGCSTATFTLDRKKDIPVKIEKQRDEDVIVVWTPVFLEFNFESCDHHTYRPLCIGFEETPDDDTQKESHDCGAEPVLGDPLGLQAFLERKIVSACGTTLLTVLDTTPVRACFKFSMVIQRSDGKLSVIDPKIHNVPM